MMTENLFSPRATDSRLIRNYETQKLYWIGNITPKNPHRNRPRYPLQIAEVDEEKTAIVRETVRVIEDKREGDSLLVQFSNFRVYEDRETHEFTLIMARIQEKAEDDLTSPAYQYWIDARDAGFQLVRKSSMFSTYRYSEVITKTGRTK